MTNTTYPRRRTVAMPEYRSRQLAAAAYCGCTSEDLIQTAITQLLVALAERDETGTLAVAYARDAGFEWDDIEEMLRIRKARKAEV